MSKDSSLTFGLSAQGLGNLSKHIYDNDFTFIVDDQHYECPRFIAGFLSPKICELQSNDPTVQEFMIETKDPHSYFKTFLSLGMGARVKISSLNLKFFQTLCRELRNGELLNALAEFFESDVNCDNVLNRLQFQHEINGSWDREREFCSSHFFELETRRLCELGFEVIEPIISNPRLKLKDEDSLYEMIKFQMKEDSRYSTLFEYVQFEHLSQNSMISFVDLISNSFDCFSFEIWSALSHRLKLPVISTVQNDRIGKLVNKIHCPFSQNCPFVGIISYLTRTCGGNIEDHKIIALNSSGIGNPTNCPRRNLVDFENRNGFITSLEANAWISYDFKDRRVNLTHYSIRSRRDYNGYHLRSWALDGSMDGQSWTELDVQMNNTTLNSPGAFASFSISQSSAFRLIRLRQLSKNSSNYLSLMINSMEFFGTLIEPCQ
jgi:hypothetical protein